jgi:hypothetical protein
MRVGREETVIPTRLLLELTHSLKDLVLIQEARLLAIQELLSLGIRKVHKKSVGL